MLLSGELTQLPIPVVLPCQEAAGREFRKVSDEN